jgi:hypothetical protein
VLPAVDRLTGLITDPLTTVPWKVVEEGFGGEILTTPRFITDPQLCRPDDRFPTQVLPCVQRLPRSAFYSSWIRQCVWAGESAMIFLEDTTGAPLAGSLRVVNSAFLTTTRDAQGALCWQIGEGDDTVTADRDGYFQVGSLLWRIVVLRDPHATPDAEGHTPGLFERHGATFGLTAQIDAFMGGTFKAGVPSGVLSVTQPNPLTQEQADGLKQAWMNAHSGSRKSVAVLASTVDFTPISFSPIDSAMIESKRANLADMCLAMCLDPNGALGISLGSSNTYSNIQSWFARLKADLMPWVETVEQTVSALLPAGRGVRMDFSEYTRPDPEQQYTALRIAVDSGIMTIDEARNILGLPPLPEPAPEPVPIPTPVPAPPQDEAAAAADATVRSIRRQPWR